MSGEVSEVGEVGDDIPAAHSMDTEWFAVDAEGHVGYFVTGEDATFPDEGWPAGSGETVATAASVHAYAFEHGWIGADEEVLARARIPALEQPGQHAWFEEQRELPGRYAAMYAAQRAKWLARPWWVRLLRPREKPRLFDPGARDGTIVMDARAPAPAGRVQRVGELQVVWIERISFDELAAIHTAGLCLGCARAPQAEDDGVLGEAGIFSFVPEIDYSGVILSPYRRVAAVQRPRTIREFEPAFARELNAVVLADAHFVRDALVQPARTLRCMGYVDAAPAYLDVDLHTVRPQRGMEAEYLRMLAELEAQAPGYRFERP